MHKPIQMTKIIHFGSAVCVLCTVLLTLNVSAGPVFTFQENVHAKSVREALSQLSIMATPVQRDFDAVIYIGTEERWKMVMGAPKAPEKNTINNTTTIAGWETTNKDIDLIIKGMSCVDGIMKSAKTIGLDISVIDRVLIFREKKITTDTNWLLPRVSAFDSLYYVHYNQVLSILQNKYNCGSSAEGIFDPKETPNLETGFWVGPNSTGMEIFIKYVQHVSEGSKPALFAFTLRKSENATPYSWVITVM